MRPDEMGDGIDVVIVTYNSAAHIAACLQSAPESTRITVVDNASSDGTPEIIREQFPRTHIIVNQQNGGYAQAVNIGVRSSSAECALVANADVVFPAGAIETLAGFLRAHTTVGLVGPQLEFPDGRWQRSYGDVPSLWQALKNLACVSSLSNVMHRAVWPYSIHRSAKSVGYVDGAVMMIRRTAFEAVGGFDEDFDFYAEEADFCLRLKKAGWQVMTFPSAHVFHVRGGSSTRVEGYSGRFLSALASANLRVLKKHHSPWQAQLYLRIYGLHCRKMLWIYRAWKLACGPRKLPHVSAMVQTFRRESRIYSGLVTEKQGSTPLE